MKKKQAKLSEIIKLMIPTLPTSNVLKIRELSGSMRTNVNQSLTKKELENKHINELLLSLNRKIREYKNAVTNENNVYANRHPMYTCVQNMKNYVKSEYVKTQIKNVKQKMHNAVKVGGSYNEGRKAYDNFVRNLDLKFINFACPQSYYG
jgi:hypothetical protein